MPRPARRIRTGAPWWRGALLWLLAFSAAGFVMWLWWHGGRDLTEVVQDAVPAAPAPRHADSVPRPPTNPPPALGVVAVPPPSAMTNPPPVATALTNPPALPPPPADFAEVLALQIGLARRAISCGSLDGVFGSQTRTAVRVFQQVSGLPTTGFPDAETTRRLSPAPPWHTNHVVTTDDLQRLMPVPATWLGKSGASRLDYETPLELIAERAGASPTLVLRLNPRLDWAYLGPGSPVAVPAAAYPPPRARAALIRISLSEKWLQAWDASSNLLFHAPCSIARRVEKRPSGRLTVTRFALGPEYLFDPEIFTESAEAREIGRKLTIPPGPNNPVGAAWISLDRPGYGIHGTPLPEQVGRTESHGCFRLANWNAEYLIKLVWAGLPVLVEP